MGFNCTLVSWTNSKPVLWEDLYDLFNFRLTNKVLCVLGAINERYEALCNIRMCLKLSVNYGQTIGVFVFFHQTECFSNFLRILNLEGQQNCMIGLKVTAILPPFYQKNSKTPNLGMWGVNPEAID